MTLINQLRKRIGFLPPDYSFYKTRGSYLLTIKGYRAGIVASSLRQLREQAWENYMACIPDIKKQRFHAKDIISGQVAAHRATDRNMHVA